MNISESTASEISFQNAEPVDILLVDDTPANLLSMEELLSAPDLNLVKCATGEQALNKCLSLRPALILLDVQMPGMDGFEVARHLRGMQRTQEIPIIFVTATQRDERLTFRGFESGAVDYLLKPLNPVILRSKVKIFVELHRSRLSLERAVRDLTSMNRELESFSYSVSHDLRGPLRRMLGFSELVMEQLDDVKDAEKKENLKRVTAAGEHMGHLIKSLLDLSRVAVGEMHFTEVNIATLAEKICQELSQEPERKPPAVRIAKNLKAKGDKHLLENVLRNLLGNAFKFTGATEQASIEVGSCPTEKGLAYFVRDNGAGFDMKYVQRLFGAFQRLHKSEEFPGTGVGLATVQRIIHRHGGQIWAESTPHEQTSFYFTLE